MGSIVAFFALNALVWWVVVLAHELGHAAIGLARTEGLVVVRAGSRSPKWRRRFGRLELELGPVPIFRSDGEAELYARVGRTTGVMFALAGPVAGGLAAALLYFLGSHLQFLPLLVIAWVALVFDLANLIPFRFRGLRSDGAYLLEVLRRPPAGDYDGDGELDAIASRWFVLATDFCGAFAARDRDLMARLNSKMRSAKAEHDTRAIAVHRLTFSGWCWRRAEQGDTTPLRDCVLDARRRATEKGLSRANTIAAAAAELVQARIEFEAGSPTPDSLEHGFRRVREDSRYDELSEGQAAVAFCFGVAMHDVATIAG